MNYMTSATEIGQRMRSCRKSIGLTQAEIAEKMDLSINYVSDLENGKKNMSILTMASLCKCFDKSADYFLYGTEDKNAGIDMEKVIEFVSTLSNQQLYHLQTYVNSLIQLKSEA